jgi:hypothetical protein
MKLNGRKIEGPNVETVIIPRGEDEPIVFRCQAVLDYDEFDLVCPRPIPPVRIMRGGRRVTDVEDKTYLKQLRIWNGKLFRCQIPIRGLILTKN